MPATKEDQIIAEFKAWLHKYNNPDVKVVEPLAAWKDCAESYEKKLAEKDTELESQRAANRDSVNWFDALKIDYSSNLKKLSEANARNAMLVEVLRDIKASLVDSRGGNYHLLEAISTAISANSEAVAAWEAEKLTDSYVQSVPDKCDRIVWRNQYFMLPPKAEAAWEAEKALAQRTGCVCKDAGGNALNQCNECPR